MAAGHVVGTLLGYGQVSPRYKAYLKSTLSARVGGEGCRRERMNSKTKRPPLPLGGFE